MNKMTQKLIKDTDENRKAKYNMITALIGGFLMILCFVCFFIKANSVEYVDKQGFLHEKLLFDPGGLYFPFCGDCSSYCQGIAYLKKHRH